MKHKIVTVIFLALAPAVLFLAAPGMKWLFLTVWVTGYAALAAYGSFTIKANWYLTSVSRLPEETVALTFDDGPEPAVTPLILDTLAKSGIKATFFLIGEKAEAHPALVRRIRDEGHSIGNHSYSHSAGIGFFGTKRLKADVQRCTEVLKQITGEEVTMFRPPFGVTNPRYAKVLRELGLNSIGWTLRSYDTVIRDREQLLKRLKTGLAPGSIVLFHDNQLVTAGILADFIEFCKTGNFKIGQLPPGGKIPGSRNEV